MSNSQYVQSTKVKIAQSGCPGFALIATMSIMLLLVLVALAMLSLSTIDMRQSRYDFHRETARANARLGLMMAIAELQQHAGPDQRVTASASILENPSGSTLLANRNWVGVWKTTHTSGNREWPLIGKSPQSGIAGPYSYKSIYSDLRETESELASRAWRNELLQDWLVSSSSMTRNPTLALDASDPAVIQLVGEGTLGDHLTPSQLAQQAVLVEKVAVSRSGSGEKGAYGWYVTDNNQKASISLNSIGTVDKTIPFLAAQTDSLSAVSDVDGAMSLADFSSQADGEQEKIITRRSAGFAGDSNLDQVRFNRAIGEHFHDLTTSASGLFVDTSLGGMRRDLSPLVFGMKNQQTINIPSPGAKVSAYDFSSDFSIIPGARHAVLGPSFAALRAWGQTKYMDGFAAGEIDAQLSHSGTGSKRIQPSTNWPHGVTDGQTFDASKWSSHAPKLHPVMVDSRWHYYFSHTDDSSVQSLRTHIIPRVCLWNPYSITMKTDELLVLMANPYWRYTNAFHFYFNYSEAQRMKQVYPVQDGVIDRWGADGAFKIRARGSQSSNKDGLFPDARYMAFVLEASSLGPGECLVFSPKVTNPDEQAGGVGIKRYDKNDVSSNVLSAASPQGEDHFFHDYETSWIQLQTENAEGRNSWLSVSAEIFREMRLSEIYVYEPWGVFHDNFPFVLKSIDGSANASVQDVTGAKAADFTTLQLINNGNGGASTYDFWHYKWWWGSSSSASSGQFGDLTAFSETPRKNAPALHQIGAKLLWLDESNNEANNAPIRISRWANDHTAYHQASVAHWNVRPSIVTRSPSSVCSAEWYVNSLGAWMLQFAPSSPQDPNDMPSLNTSNTAFSKSPFGAALNFSSAPEAVMFDLPHKDYGSLSIGSLRHAQVSPYSWHPTYVIGHSLADIHAPYEASANLSQESNYTGAEKSGWDAAIGGTRPYPLTYGPRTWGVNSTGLLQVGNGAASKSIANSSLSSRDEILAYDIAFEVNQNLWDRYFFSGIPMSASGDSFDWEPSSDSLWNVRYQRNPATKMMDAEIASKLGSSTGVDFGFWHNAYLLNNRGAFNVNSTSVEAWVAFLSGLQGLQRPTASGQAGGGTDSVFSRLIRPLDAVKSGATSAEGKGGWAGGRTLSSDEIRALAEQIVIQVKKRGPFVSLADFVNRRLAPKADTASRMGALEEAILLAQLNSQFEGAAFLTTNNNANDNNLDSWRVDLDKQPKSKAWGIPGYLTQGDLLEPLAPAMTVRGDSFLIRSYGESQNNAGDIVARAYLEAVVMRSPDYVQAAEIDETSPHANANTAVDSMMEIDPTTGAVREGGLSDINRRFGRKFILKSFRWLSNEEI